ncbi:MAG TPA: DUF2905 domain-containing protein [Bacteroidota bacterium]
MPALGKVLLLVGLVIAAVGLVLIFSDRVPWLGKLPGDITIDRGNFRVYVPITTCILLSVVISLVLWVLSQLRK